MAQQGGATGFVMKPVSAAPLLAAVEAALNGGGECN
jgi:DNA-binding NarL/FixJ family response regulator